MVLDVCLSLKWDCGLRQIKKVQKSYHHTIYYLIRNASSPCAVIKNVNLVKFLVFNIINDWALSIRNLALLMITYIGGNLESFYKGLSFDFESFFVKNVL
jgi:hypothetical protein